MSLINKKPKKVSELIQFFNNITQNENIRNTPPTKNKVNKLKNLENRTSSDYGKNSNQNKEKTSSEENHFLSKLIVDFSKSELSQNGNHIKSVDGNSSDNVIEKHENTDIKKDQKEMPVNRLIKLFDNYDSTKTNNTVMSKKNAAENEDKVKQRKVMNYSRRREEKADIRDGKQNYYEKELIKPNKTEDKNFELEDKNNKFKKKSLYPLDFGNKAEDNETTSKFGKKSLYPLDFSDKAEDNEKSIVKERVKVINSLFYEKPKDKIDEIINEVYKILNKTKYNKLDETTYKQNLNELLACSTKLRAVPRKKKIIEKWEGAKIFIDKMIKDLDKAYKK